MSIDRRDFFRLLAASTAAAAGGCRAPERLTDKPVDFDGRIVGQAHAHCHRLRDGFAGLPARGAVAADEPLRDVLIVGAGLSGLTAAWALQHAGVEDFLLLERSDEIGGVARGGSVEGIPCPWGAHYIGLPDPDSPVLMRLLTAVGVIDDFTPDRRPVIHPRHLVKKPEVNLYHGLSSSRGYFPWAMARKRDLRQLYEFRRDTYRWDHWRDAQGRPAFQLPVEYATDAEEVQRLDALTLAEYFDSKGWDSPMLRHYVSNRTTDEYGCTADEISAYAALMYWANEEASDNSAPRAKRDTKIISWPEGNAFLVRSLARLLPAGSIRTDAWVTEISNHAGEVRATVRDPRTGLTHVYRARRCIFAGPKHRADLILPELPEPYRREIDGLRYTPWLVANLLLSDCPDHDARSLAWDNLIHDSWSLGFVNGRHFDTPGKDPKDQFLITFYASFSGAMREPARRDLLELPWSDWAALIVDELERAMPDVRRQVERLDLWRWGHAMVSPVPGAIFGPTRQTLCTPVGRIHFAGNDATMLPLYEEAVFRGVAAAEEVLTGLGRPFRSLLEPEHERLG